MQELTEIETHQVSGATGMAGGTIGTAVPTTPLGGRPGTDPGGTIASPILF